MNDLAVYIICVTTGFLLGSFATEYWIRSWPVFHLVGIRKHDRCLVAIASSLNRKWLHNQFLRGRASGIYLSLQIDQTDPKGFFDTFTGTSQVEHWTDADFVAELERDE